MPGFASRNHSTQATRVCLPDLVLTIYGFTGLARRGNQGPTRCIMKKVRGLYRRSGLEGVLGTLTTPRFSNDRHTRKLTIMSLTQPVWVSCSISRSSFSGERILHIDLANGEKYVGAAPLHYFAQLDRSLLPAGEPAPGGSLTGLVRARQLENGGDRVRIALPDGETVIIPRTAVSPRSPREDLSSVPI
jgi:hypothetical protein